MWGGRERGRGEEEGAMNFGLRVSRRRTGTNRAVEQLCDHEERTGLYFDSVGRAIL